MYFARLCWEVRLLKAMSEFERGEECIAMRQESRPRPECPGTSAHPSSRARRASGLDARRRLAQHPCSLAGPLVTAGSRNNSGKCSGNHSSLRRASTRMWACLRRHRTTGCTPTRRRRRCCPMRCTSSSSWAACSARCVSIHSFAGSTYTPSIAVDICSLLPAALYLFEFLSRMLGKVIISRTLAPVAVRQSLQTAGRARRATPL